MKTNFSAVCFMAFLFLWLFGSYFDSIACAETSKKIKVNLVDQGIHNPSLKGLMVLEGFKVEIVAQNPTVVNPVAISFSSDVKALVLERTPDFSGNVIHPNNLENKPSTKIQIDLIKSFSFNTSTNLLENPTTALKLNAPSAFILHQNHIYLGNNSSITRCKINQEGIISDQAETIVKASMVSKDFQFNGFAFAPDGWLYFHFPPDFTVLQGTDGSKIYTSGSGGIARCKSDGTFLQLFCRGLRQTQGTLTFDHLGNLFFVDQMISNGNNSAGARLLHLTEGYDFGWKVHRNNQFNSPDLFRIINEGDDAPSSVINFPKTLAISSHAYSDIKLPDKYKNLLLIVDETSQEILGVTPAVDKSSFHSSEYYSFLSSQNLGFFPSQITQGPDGALYVVDKGCSYGSSGTGTGGRILRLTWQGTKDLPPSTLREFNASKAFEAKKVPDLISLLESSDSFIKARARDTLVLKGKESSPALLKLLADEDKDASSKLYAMQVLAHQWNNEIQTAFEIILDSGEPELQILSAQYLGRFASLGSESASNALLKQLGTESPMIREAVAIAMGKINAPGAAESLIISILFYEGTDFRLLHSFASGLEFSGNIATERILAVGDTGVKKDIRKVLETQNLMHTESSLAALIVWLENPNIGTTDIVDLLHGLKNYQHLNQLEFLKLCNFLSKDIETDAQVNIAALEALSGFPDLAFGNLESWIAKCLSHSDMKIKIAAINLIKAAKITTFSKKLTDSLASQSISDDEKVALCEALADLKQETTVPLIQSILTGVRSSKESTRVKLAALQFLFKVQNKLRYEIALNLLGSVLTPDELKKKTLQLLLNDPKGSKSIFHYYNSSQVEPSELPLISESLKKYGAKLDEGGNFNSLLLKKELLSNDNSKKIQLFENHIKANGSAERGKDIFLGSKSATCLKCHSLGGTGFPIGPDLGKLNLVETSKLTRSILDPSHEIKTGYHSFELKTILGKTLTVLKILGKDNQPLFVDIDGEILKIKQDEILSLNPLKISLMPDSFSTSLSYNDLADLIAFLKSPDNEKQLQGVGVTGVLTFKDSDIIQAKLQTCSTNGFFNISIGNQILKEDFTFDFYLFSRKRAKTTVSITTQDKFDLQFGSDFMSIKSIKVSDYALDYELDLQEGPNQIRLNFPKESKPLGFFLRFSGDEIRCFINAYNPSLKK